MQPAVRGSARGWDDLTVLFRRLMRDAEPSSGMLFLLPPQEKVLHLSLLYGTSWHIVAPWARIRVDEAIPAAAAAREARLIWVGSLEELALRYPRLALVVPDHTLAAAPILTEDAVWGTVCLLWPSSHGARLGRGERQAIDAFCRDAGPVLRHAADAGAPLRPGACARVLEAVRPRTPDPAEALAAHDFAARLPGAMSLDLEGRVGFVTDATADLLGTQAADLMGVRPWELLEWLGDSVFEARFRDTVIGHQSAHFTARRAPAGRLSFRLYPDASGVSVDIAPCPHTPSAEPEEAGRPPADPVGAVTLYHLMHLAASLTETVRVEDVADRVADQLVPGFGAAGLALMTVADGRLRVVGHRGYSVEFMARFDGDSLAAPSPPAQALTRQRPLFFASFDDFRDAYPEAVRYGNRNAWAFLPLVIRGRPVGLLVLSYDELRPFTPAERNLLISVAGLIAQALDRSRLYDAKHSLARTLQSGLLPRRLPAVPGLEVAARYLPAGHGMEIGGDFYDLIRCGATGAAATIGDVQGHNVRAAALMGQLRTAVHSHAAAGAHPAELLARTNRLMCDLNPGLFASCLYIRLDLDLRSACLATAGHLPPLLRRPDGRTEVLRPPAGLLLGITPDTDYRAVEVPLPPGTTLVLYTDGLVEAPGADIDQAIGDLAHRLALARDDDMHALSEVLLAHAPHGVPRVDDIAMLLIRTTDVT
ncbi:GAF domain-containing SpoIIE family protein phosphatase [Streptomyces sp. NPDC026672]|uniref:PP2C family protein-serine/threonine phosphatase n=1 Tax=unclassified Streptomyces TaxID=2593676 RepID=UPI0033CE9DD6